MKKEQIKGTWHYTGGGIGSTVIEDLEKLWVKPETVEDHAELAATEYLEARHLVERFAFQNGYMSGYKKAMELMPSDEEE